MTARARRGHGKAIVAKARKLAVVLWCMMTRGEDYAHQQPSLTKKKPLRRPEITAGAPKYAKSAGGVRSSNLAIRHVRPSARSPSRSRSPTGGDGHGPAGRGSSEKGGRERDTGARRSGPSAG
jgi:hypothetical protein